MSNNLLCKHLSETLELKDVCQLSNTEQPHIKDSGNRTEFVTGAVRDCGDNKGRCDLMPLDMISVLMSGDRVLSALGDFQNLSSSHKASMMVSLKDALDAFCHDRYYENLADMLLDVSMHFRDGAKKYGEYNWQKGIPIHSYIDSAVRHYLKWKSGWTDEPHDRAFVWNILCCMWTLEHKPELDDVHIKEEQNHE